jgi:hypothetical protein
LEHTLLGGRSPVGIASLLGLQDKMAALVTINTPETVGTISIVLEYALLENIIIDRVIAA